MELAIYFIIFIIGALLGSFFSLAIYRIPLKQNITHERSYCPNCNHRLEFLDLIPIFSYVFLGGKCRYCKQKIRPRYILLEIFSGILFLLFVISLKFNIYNLEIQKLIYLLFGTLYISSLFIIGGIEKETHSISNSVLLFGLISQTIYIIYLYILNISIYKYAIYLFLMLILILVNTILLRKKGKENYTIQILTLCSYFAIVTKEQVIIVSIIFTLLLIAVKQILITTKNKKQQMAKVETQNKIPIGFYLCFTNIVVLILQNYIF
ncbi:MAG: prepilin peptidase [Clostridia bacterium]|nr:prepilin peptidase [Clostridia bacterium]